jgi:L-ascorbate metabolism protein UlaG (beta-lactamase superfamily)
MIRAKLFLPMHYNTFAAIKADASEFVRKVEGKGMNAKVVGAGASVEI